MKTIKTRIRERIAMYTNEYKSVGVYSINAYGKELKTRISELNNVLSIIEEIETKTPWYRKIFPFGKVKIDNVTNSTINIDIK